MQKLLRAISLVILLSVAACREPQTPDEPQPPAPPNNKIEHVDYSDIVWGEGERYVWNYDYVPEITVKVPLQEWNALLLDYDRSSETEKYIHCDVEFKRGNDVTVIKDAGFRLRGNTSRRRPEGEKGQLHSKNPDWRKCHFGLNFKKFVKEDSQELMGIGKFHLKWFHEDPTYVREIFCYDVFRRAGIWTALQDNYCRLWIHVEGDEKPAYYGVYNLMERVDKQYLKRRKANFGSAKGNLWKCVIGADLTAPSVGRMGPDTEEKDFPYELKESDGTYAQAAEQLRDFIKNVSGLDDDAFFDWIRKVCDVDFLLRTYAVNVAMGGWDDHWVNSNNFYLYFNSNDPKDYKVFLIPYDYDNTLGTCQNCGGQTDAVKQDPYNWGNQGILIQRLMKFDECREIYRKELLRVIDPAEGLLDFTPATEQIQRWQLRVKSFVRNDTGEDMSIEDKPASWGTHPEYRVLDPAPGVNFFRVKSQVIKSMQK